MRALPLASVRGVRGGDGRACGRIVDLDRWQRKPGAALGAIRKDSVVADEVDVGPWQQCGESSHEQREAFLLREMEGLSFPEIGAIQGASLETARGRVLLAMKSLRRSLDGFGGPR